MKFNNDFKSMIIDSDYPRIDKVLSYEGFLFDSGLIIPEWCDHQNKEDFLRAYFEVWDKYPTEMQCAHQLNNAMHMRLTRMKSRVNTIIQEPSLFLTLTFNDNSLNNLSDLTRRRYVCNYLRSLNCNYVANIDFGSVNGREHYHALVQHPRVDCHDYTLGAMNFERVRGNTIKDSNGLSKYITKLALHALKGTTRFNRCIYSRNKGGAGIE